MLECKLFIDLLQPAQSDLLRLLLSRCGVSEQQIIENTCKGKTYLSFFSKSATKAEKLLTRIRALKLKNIKLAVSSLKDNQWKTRWKKYVLPFKITRRMRVIPLWKQKPKARINERDIYIDTTFAFGTGLHATTRLMAYFIEQKRGQYSSFFDIGTGSGILSVIASRYGAKDLYAIDFDKPSVVTAGRNFKVNRCQCAYLKAISFEDYCFHRQFDFVAANLLTEDLIRLKERLISCVRPGKYLAVSGIHQDNYRRFRLGFRNNSLKCLRVLKRDNWCALLFTRKKRIS